MTGLIWMVGGGMGAWLVVGLALALCRAAARADGEATEVAVDRVGGPDDLAARRVRAALQGWAAWVFSASEVDGRLHATGRGGAPLSPVGEVMARRAAGLAMHGEVPVIVPLAAGGPLDDMVFVGVSVPFADGRRGALVVAGEGGTAAGSWTTRVLQGLVEERAELGMRVAADRADRFTVQRSTTELQATAHQSK